jgi:methyl-accepting chemotaxis protein
MKKLIGNTEIEDSLNRLDRLTQEEARMASAELLRITHGVDDRVQDVHTDVQDVGRKVQGIEGRMQDVLSDVQDVGEKVQGIEGGVQDIHCDMQDVGNQVQGVEGKVQDVRGDVQDVGDKVQDVDDRVRGLGSDVKDISSNVRGVDIKLDQVTRSLSRYHLLTVPSAQTYSQGISSEIVFYDGFRPQIHLSIITSHPKPITTAQLNGSFKAVYSINGNPLTLLCGYTENVRLLLAFII